jgi:hypothetical protein
LGNTAVLALEEKTTLLIEKPSRGEKIPWSLYTGIFRQSLFIRFSAILFSSKQIKNSNKSRLKIRLKESEQREKLQLRKKKNGLRYYEVGFKLRRDITTPRQPRVV